MSNTEPLNKKLYDRIKKMADKKFSSKTGVYKSSWIVKEYKRLGGEYSTPKPKTDTGLQRWYKEEWVDLNRPIKIKGKTIGYEECGRKSILKKPGDKGKYPLCRPTKRVTFATPKTVSELDVKIIKKAKRDKSKIEDKGNVKFTGGKPQFFGKKSDIMIEVPKDVKQWAKYAFILKDMGFKGALETGWKRAEQLSTQKEISIQDLRYMRNWYARHIYASYPTFKEWIKAGKPNNTKWHNKHGIISWVTWSGNAGLKWVNSKRVIDMLNKYFNKNYSKIVVKK